MFKNLYSDLKRCLTFKKETIRQLEARKQREFKEHLLNQKPVPKFRVCVLVFLASLFAIWLAVGLISVAIKVEKKKRLDEFIRRPASSIRLTNKADILKTERKKVVIVKYEPVKYSVPKTPTTIQEYAKQLAGDEFCALDYIIRHESNYNPYAQNPRSTAYGIGQFLDGTWKGTGYTKTSDPYKQLEAMIIYCNRHHGSITKAYQFKISRGWY